MALSLAQYGSFGNANILYVHLHDSPLSEGQGGKSASQTPLARSGDI